MSFRRRPSREIPRARTPERKLLVGSLIFLPFSRRNLKYISSTPKQHQPSHYKRWLDFSKLESASTQSPFFVIALSSAVDDRHRSPSPLFNMTNYVLDNQGHESVRFCYICVVTMRVRVSIFVTSVNVIKQSLSTAEDVGVG